MAGLSVGANLSWQIAAHEAASARFQFIEAEHIFIGICSLEKVVGLSPEDSGLSPKDLKALKEEYSILQDLGLDMTQLRRRMRKKLGAGNYRHTEKVIHRSEACKKMFSRAYEIASSEEVACLHLLAAMLEKPGNINQVLSELNIDAESLSEQIKDHIGKADETIPESKTRFLDKYGRDLTQFARDGKLGPFIGRRNELLQLIQTLARSMKNNPVLIGEPGTGKTAIVEALAVRAVEGKDTQVLGGKRIIELNMGVLVGGTKYRGEFEERLTRIIEEACSNPEIIIFIDEIHTLVGAGAGSSNIDAANLMKPALARGELRCIGATTIAEYRKHIESDPALERRFEKITVNEPSRDEAIEILKGIKPKWEKHFNKKISDMALEAAVDLSIRFDTDHYLPDKAVDLVDKAGARMQVPLLSMGPDMKIKPESMAVDSGEVTEYTIAQVLSEKINVPMEIIAGHLDGASGSRLLELNSYLKKKIIGQDDAIERVSQRLIMAHAGVGKKRGPLAVFLFLGPTGVGKTELAKSLAEFLFGSGSSLIRLDMSEFMEEHSVSKLIGSPPGYVGHDEEGQLTGKLRTRPYSVVLLDEVEKAHQRVFDLFLQVFDEGRITDSKGRTVDARHAIFILTSNLMQNEHAKKKIGFIEKADEPSIEDNSEVRRFFRPELINRIDEQIVFSSLGEDAIRRILHLLFREIADNLRERYKVELKLTEDAERYIAQKGYNPQYGARELRRTVERLIQMPLSNLILSGRMKESKEWQVVCKGSDIAVVSIDYT